MQEALVFTCAGRHIYGSNTNKLTENIKRNILFGNKDSELGIQGSEESVGQFSSGGSVGLDQMKSDCPERRLRAVQPGAAGMEDRA